MPKQFLPALPASQRRAATPTLLLDGAIYHEISAETVAAPLDPTITLTRPFGEGEYAVAADARITCVFVDETRQIRREAQPLRSVVDAFSSTPIASTPSRERTIE